MPLSKPLWVTKEELLGQCLRLGLVPGDLIMVHASLKAVGEILGGPDILIEALRETIGAKGTMMMYAGCQMPFDDLGRGIYDIDEENFILQNCPPFDPNTARASRDFGALAEFFRSTPGVCCSINPSCRMAAVGERSSWLLSQHPLNYGMGKGSPLEKLCEADGKLVLIGSDLDAVTLLHYAEAIASIPNKKIVRIKVPLLINGKREWIEVEEFNSSSGICDWEDSYFALIVKKYIAADRCLASGLIGKATTYVLSAADLVHFAVPIMEEDASSMEKLNAD